MRTGDAAVIGASIGGLLAARVLAEQFERVTLVEQDELPTQPANRRGVPQAQHTHGLLAGGREALEALFPGFTADIVHAGAITGDLTGTVRWYLEDGYHQRFESGLLGLGVSRPLLEHCVRARTLGLPNVHLLPSAIAEGLEPTPDRRGVGGVRLKRAGATDSEVLAASLVIDAGGRGSRALGWLAELGHTRPVEERIEIGLGYTTRIYRYREGDLGGDNAILVVATPANTRSGTALRQEGGRWTVTLIGYAGDVAPATESGYQAFAESLPTPDIATLIRTAEPLSDFVSTRFPANQRRRFERLPTVPAGFLAFGDAMCSFNPAYGQGMSVAAQEALVLKRAMSNGRAGLERRFYRSASKLIDSAWSIAAGNDLRMPGVKGSQTPLIRFVNWYVARLNRAAHRDAAVALAFQRVTNLLAPPTTILAPGVVLRVTRAGAA